MVNKKNKVLDNKLMGRIKKDTNKSVFFINKYNKY
jgi:hypothetical protein